MPVNRISSPRFHKIFTIIDNSPWLSVDGATPFLQIRRLKARRSSRVNRQVSPDRLLEPSDHPFVAFLSSLPEEVPDFRNDRTPLTPTEAMGYLRRLDEALAKSGPLLKLDLDTPRRVADRAKFNLDYLQFFKKWLKDLHPNTPSGGHRVGIKPFDESKDDDVAYSWVKPVRSLIKSRYYR